MLTPYDFFLAGSILRANDEDVAESESRVMIFVTGSLLPGGRDNYLVMDSYCVGPARTVEQFATRPSLGVDAPAAPITNGVVYEVRSEVLSRIDLFKGFPYSCHREIVDVVLGDSGTGPVVQAWMYFS